jgi:hypothetical protein
MSVPAFGDADGEVKLIPSRFIGLRGAPVFAIPAKDSSGLGIDDLAIITSLRLSEISVLVYANCKNYGANLAVS